MDVGHFLKFFVCRYSSDTNTAIFDFLLLLELTLESVSHCHVSFFHSVIKILGSLPFLEKASQSFFIRVITSSQTLPAGVSLLLFACLQCRY